MGRERGELVSSSTPLSSFDWAHPKRDSLNRGGVVMQAKEVEAE